MTKPLMTKKMSTPVTPLSQMLKCPLSRDVKQCGGVTKHNHLGGDGAQHLDKAIGSVGRRSLLQRVVRAGLSRECNGGVSGH